MALFTLYLYGLPADAGKIIFGTVLDNNAKSNDEWQKFSIN
jgi:hypothetical protein